MRKHTQIKFIQNEYKIFLFFQFISLNIVFNVDIATKRIQFKSQKRYSIVYHSFVMNFKYKKK